MLRPKLNQSITWLMVFITFGVFCRFSLWLRISQTPQLTVTGDGVGYEQVARNLLKGVGFSMETAPPYLPDMIRTPGYPLFIAAIYRIFGYRPEMVTLAQNLLSVGLLLVGYLLARRLFGLKAAMFATILMALDVGAIILANVTLTETLFIILFVSVTYCLFRSFDSPRGMAWIAGAGLLLGLATLVRPASLYLVVVLLPLIWWTMRYSWQEKGVRTIIFVVVFLLVLAPWSYRNFRVFGSPNITLAVQSITLNIHASYIRAGLNHTTLAEEEPRIPEQVRQELGGRTVGVQEMDELIRAKAIAEIMQHPVEYVFLYIKSMFITLTLPNTNFLANILGILNQPTGIIADMRTRSLTENIQALLEFGARYLAGSPDQTLFFIAMVTEVLVTLVTHVLAVVGTVIGLRSERRAYVVLLLIIIAYFFIITGPIGTGRYRLPAMPYLMMLAGYGFVWLQARGQTRQMSQVTVDVS